MLEELCSFKAIETGKIQQQALDLYIFSFITKIMIIFAIVMIIVLLLVLGVLNYTEILVFNNKYYIAYGILAIFLSLIVKVYFDNKKAINNSHIIDYNYNIKKDKDIINAVLPSIEGIDLSYKDLIIDTNELNFKSLISLSDILLSNLYKNKKISLERNILDRKKFKCKSVGRLHIYKLVILFDFIKQNLFVNRMEKIKITNVKMYYDIYENKYNFITDLNLEKYSNIKNELNDLIYKEYEIFSCVKVSYGLNNLEGVEIEIQNEMLVKEAVQRINEYIDFIPAKKREFDLKNSLDKKYDIKSGRAKMKI